MNGPSSTAPKGNTNRHTYKYAHIQEELGTQLNTVMKSGAWLGLEDLIP